MRCSSKLWVWHGVYNAYSIVSWNRTFPFLAIWDLFVKEFVVPLEDVSCITRRHVLLFNKGACLLVDKMRHVFMSSCWARKGDVSTCSTRGHVLLLDKRRCLLAQQKHMSTCRLVQQERMSSCRTGGHVFRLNQKTCRTSQLPAGSWRCWTWLARTWSRANKGTRNGDKTDHGQANNDTKPRR